MTTLQEKAEQHELDEELRNLRYQQEEKKVNQRNGIQSSEPASPTHLQHRRTSNVSHSHHKSSPFKQINAQELAKSPIVEYLKQCNKDNLLPHFLPFKNL